MDGTSFCKPWCDVSCSVGVTGPRGVHLSGYYIDRIQTTRNDLREVEGAVVPQDGNAEGNVNNAAEMGQKLQSILKNVTTIERYLNKIGAELIKETGHLAEGGSNQLERITSEEKDQKHLSENPHVLEPQISTKGELQEKQDGVKETGIELGSHINSIATHVSDTLNGGASVFAPISSEPVEDPKEVELESVGLDVIPDSENESEAIVSKSNEESVEVRNHIFGAIASFASSQKGYCIVNRRKDIPTGEESAAKSVDIDQNLDTIFCNEQPIDGHCNKINAAVDLDTNAETQSLKDENHTVAVPSMFPEAECVEKLGKKKGKKHHKSEIALDNARIIGCSEDTGDHHHVNDKKKRRNKPSISLEAKSNNDELGEKKESISQRSGDHGHASDNKKRSDDCNLVKPKSSKLKNRTDKEATGNINGKLSKMSWPSIDHIFCDSSEERRDPHLKANKRNKRKRDHRDDKIIQNYPAESQVVDLSVPKETSAVEKGSSKSSLILQKTHNGENGSMSESIFRKKKKQSDNAGQQVDSSVPNEICESEKGSSTRSLILENTNNAENGLNSESIVRKKKKQRYGDVATDEHAKVSLQERKSEVDVHSACEKATKVSASEKATKVGASKTKKSLVENGVDSSSVLAMHPKSMKKNIN